MSGRIERGGHTHGRVPGCANARGICAGRTHAHTRQWPSRDTHSRPPCRSCGVEPSAYHTPRSLHTPQHARGARPSAFLTHRRRTHTTHSAVAGAPPCGMTQRSASISPHSGPEPSSPGGCSPTAQGASVNLPRPSTHTPTSLSLPRPAHRTGVRHVSWLGAQGIETPGMGSELCSGLQNSLAAPQVVTGITIEVSTQPSHTTVEVGGQLYQHPGAWWHYKK